VSAATVKHLDPTHVELEIAIDEGELAAARERAFRQLVKNVRIPGFRPGKAPRKIFEAQYGTAAIEERAMDAVVPEAYSKALQENDLDPVDRPQMELLPEEEGQPLRVRATVYVRPQFALGEYKGIALIGPPVAVSEHDVETTIANLQKDSATLVPVDRPIALGDTPTIDYEGKIDGVPFEGGRAENQPTEIAEDRFIPGFAAGIVGLSAGETKEVEAHFPDDYQNAELAGKTAVFTVKVHDNKVAELPELDDEFAKRILGEDATVATLREDARRRIEIHRRATQRRELTGKLMEKILASVDFPLPAVLVDRESENLFAEAKGYVERAGLEWAKYLEEQGKTEAQLRDEYRVEAEKRVKTSLLIEAIAKAENITATEADLEAEIGQLSRQYGQPRAAILEMLRPNLNALIDGIVRTKTVEFLLDNAKVTEIASPPQP
jgi:trigger factor